MDTRFGLIHVQTGKKNFHRGLPPPPPGNSKDLLWLRGGRYASCLLFDQSITLYDKRVRFVNRNVRTLNCFKVEDKMKELDTVISALTKKRDEEAGGVMQKLEEALHEKQKEEAKAKSALTNKNDTLKAENKKLNQLNKQLSNVSEGPSLYV